MLKTNLGLKLTCKVGMPKPEFSTGRHKPQLGRSAKLDIDSRNRRHRGGDSYLDGSERREVQTATL